VIIIKQQYKILLLQHTHALEIGEYYDNYYCAYNIILTRVTAGDGDERDEDGEDERHGRDGDRHGVPSGRSICRSSMVHSRGSCSSSVHRRNIILPSNTESTPSVAAAADDDVLARDPPRTAAILPHACTPLCAVSACVRRTRDV